MGVCATELLFLFALNLNSSGHGHISPMKNRKRLAHGVLGTSAIYADLVYDIEIDCQTKSPYFSVLVTFKR